MVSGKRKREGGEGLSVPTKFSATGNSEFNIKTLVDKLKGMAYMLELNVHTSKVVKLPINQHEESHYFHEHIIIIL